MRSNQFVGNKEEIVVISTFCASHDELTKDVNGFHVFLSFLFPSRNSLKNLFSVKEHRRVMTKCITLLASEWKSSKGGLSTINRELAIQFAKLSNTSVSFLVPDFSDEDKREASKYNVKIVKAEERPGFNPIDWLTFPPKDLAIDFVIGHGVILGKQAQIIRDSHQCKWVQVVHTAPDELAVYKEYSSAISIGEEKQSVELKLCKMADLVVAIGPKLTEFYTALLNSCGKEVFNFTPGVFNQFASLNVSSVQGKRFRILVFGRGDTEDFKLKGYDIAAQAVAKLVEKTYHLTFLGASKGSQSHVTKELLKYGLLQSQLIVKGFLENREDLITNLCASNLVIIPSRTEGFGLTALEALSAGIPFLVSQNSGFGEALQEIPRRSAAAPFIVDSEDPEDWAAAIKVVRQKGSKGAFQECQELRALYAEKYNWQTQCVELFSMMKSLINGEYCTRDNIN